MTQTGQGQPDMKDQAGKVLSQVAGFIGVKTIEMGLRLGLIQDLADNPAGLTASDLASRTGMDPEYTKVWCRAAYASELLDLAGPDTYVLAAHMDTLLLNEDSPRIYRWSAVANDAARVHRPIQRASPHWQTYLVERGRPRPDQRCEPDGSSFLHSADSSRSVSSFGPFRPARWRDTGDGPGMWRRSGSDADGPDLSTGNAGGRRWGRLFSWVDPEKYR